MTEEMQSAVARFSSNPGAASQILRELLDADRERFGNTSLSILRDDAHSAGSRYLALLLLQQDMLLAHLCNPDQFSRQQAVNLAKHAARADPLLDIKLARLLPDPNGRQKDQVDDIAAERVLEILDAISPGTRVVPLLSQRLQHANPRLRSKIALLVGRRVQNLRWAESHLNEMDPRVRANIVETMWTIRTTGVRALLSEAVKDSNNRVAGNALYGLYLAEDLAVIPRMVQMASDERPDFRSSAAWAMGATLDPRFLPVITPLLRDASPVVRTAAFEAILRLKKAAATAASAGRLQIQFLRAEMTPDLGRRIWVSVLGEGNESPALRPLHFVLQDNETLVGSYELTEVTRQENLILGFSFSLDSGISQEFLKAAEEGVLGCLPRKRRTDLWAAVKLSPGMAPTRFHWQGNVEEARSLRDGFDAPVRYTGDADAFKRDVQRPWTRSRSSPATLEAIRLLVRAGAPLRGRRHIIVLCGPNTSQSFDFDAVVKATSKADVTIHGVAAMERSADAASQPFDRFCRRTGGSFVTASTPDEIRNAYKSVYMSLFQRYEIEYAASPEAQAAQTHTARLQIYSSDGYGEAQTAFSAY
ncbi:MAG: HEAT repeat domain-containing protein [Bryobacteraceae bacterium]